MKPFFSVIIPTKDRPALLRDAMKSVILQDFDDYELIVSDNFNNERTKEVVDEFGSDPRLKYIRPDKELNIPDHWEFAGKKASGKYVLILTDRSFLKQGALKEVYSVIKESKEPSAVFWKYGYFNEKKGVLRSERSEPGFRNFSSLSLLEEFSRTLDAHSLPRPHVGCYRHDLIEKIRNDIGALYLPYAPDYTSSLLVLAHIDNVVFIPRPLFFFQGASVSAGTRAQSNITRYLKSLNLSDPYEFVPIKSSVNTNMIFNDLAKIKNIAGGNFRKIDINWVFYFVLYYQTLVEMKIIWGVKGSKLAGFWKEWSRTLSTFDKNFQKLVRAGIRRRWFNIFKSYLRETFLGSVLLGFKRLLMKKPTYRFSNMLEAGGFNFEEKSQ